MDFIQKRSNLYISNYVFFFPSQILILIWEEGEEEEPLTNIYLIFIYL